MTSRSVRSAADSVFIEADLSVSLGCVRLSRTGDEITYFAARPFAQIDQAAAVAAEGEFRILAAHRLLADGALQLQSPLASHRSLDDFRDQIVVVALR